MIELLGAVPLATQPTDYYPTVQRGIADAAVIGWAQVTTFKLQEVTKYHIDLPLGCTTGGFFMNKESYGRLPQDLRAGLDAASGDALAKFMGEESGRQEAAADQKIAATPGAVMIKLDPKEQARWEARLRPISAEWAQSHPDGEKVLATFRAEIAKRKGS
jgi:TRAP-type C4-dicarboxylate transport system substrate-binding protein